MVCFGQGRREERGRLLFAQPSKERISKGGRGVRAFKGSQKRRVGVSSDFSAYGTSSYELKFTKRGNIVIKVYEERCLCIHVYIDRQIYVGGTHKYYTYKARTLLHFAHERLRPSCVQSIDVCNVPLAERQCVIFFALYAVGM